MKTTRVTAFGRRMKSLFGDDDKNLLFAEKPGFT